MGKFEQNKRLEQSESDESLRVRRQQIIMSIIGIAIIIIMLLTTVIQI